MAKKSAKTNEQKDKPSAQMNENKVVEMMSHKNTRTTERLYTRKRL